ncbi:MAG: hypothetical protein N3A54_02045 [Patescibacteria group bacterium]|nr:hypothetical protein [Patescibacteria group bacterium]
MSEILRPIPNEAHRYGPCSYRNLGAVDSSIAKALREGTMRKDHGAIHYIQTVGEALNMWQQDKHGKNTWRFLQQAYGIPNDQISSVLERGGWVSICDTNKKDDLLGW